VGGVDVAGVGEGGVVTVGEVAHGADNASENEATLRSVCAIDCAQSIAPTVGVDVDGAAGVPRCPCAALRRGAAGDAE
jgi:hypothetical protein